MVDPILIEMDQKIQYFLTTKKEGKITKTAATEKAARLPIKGYFYYCRVQEEPPATTKKDCFRSLHCQDSFGAHSVEVSHHGRGHRIKTLTVNWLLPFRSEVYIKKLPAIVRNTSSE